jgi:predicted nucleic acid-binding protein
MELLKGARNQSEQRMLKRFLLDVGFELLPVDPAVCHRAVIYMEAFALCSGLDMADALIGATSSEHGLTLCTADDKHYRAMSELELRVFRP